MAAGRWGISEAAEPVSLPDDDLSAVLGIARIDRLGGLLTAAIDSGAVLASDEATGRIRELWHQQLLSSVVVEAQAVRAAEVLDAASVVWRLTKGPAAAHLDYPDPALRPFGDVDVLVYPESWDAARHALVGAGFHREVAELRPGYDSRFGKGATFISPQQLELDVHRRFAVGRFGVRSRMEEVFTAAQTISLAGRPIPTLDPTGRLLHACHHATLGGFRHLRAHRDVAQLLLVTGADWQATVAVAARWRVEAVVARAVVETWQRLALHQPHPALVWAQGYRTSAADERALAVFAAERPFREQALTATRVVPPRDLPAFARAHLSARSVRSYMRSRRLRPR